MKNKNELIKRWLIVIFAAVFMIITAVLFGLSLEIYDDGYGTDVSFDMDMIVCFLCGIALLVYGIYSLYALKKKKSMQLAYYGAFGVIAVLTTFYPLGVFFKAMAKKKPFLENQDYLYLGILGLILLIYLIVSYLGDKQENA